MSKTTLAAEAHDFAPDLLTLQESPPSNRPRTLIVGTVVLVGLLIAWGAWARLDIVVTAQGRLVPVSYTKVVQPAEPGVVKEILVQDGDLVKAGQVMLRLDARFAQADVSALGSELALKQLMIQRIEADLSEQAFVPRAGAPKALAAQVMAQHLARRQSLNDLLAQEDAALARSQSELAAARQTLIKLRGVVPITRAAAEKHAELEKAGFISQLASADRQREHLEKSQELQAQIEAVNALKAAISQNEKKVDSVRSNYRSQLENERIELVGQVNRLQQELDKSTMRGGQMNVHAPADGVVKDLAVTSAGAVVQAGALLMNIVPQSDPLQAEIALGNEDAGFVAKGQKVQIKIAAFPFQKYGLVEGVVSHVGADATQSQGPQPSLNYRALVKLSRQEFDSPQGERLTLSPGMLVTAEIQQGQRSVIEYLLSPVQKVSMEAARER